MSSLSSSSTVDNATNFPVPAEVRNMIWEYALAGSVARMSDYRPDPDKVHEISSPLAALYVSRSTRAETISMVLSLVTFDVRSLPLESISTRLGTGSPLLLEATQLRIDNSQVTSLTPELALFPNLRAVEFSWPNHPTNTTTTLAERLDNATDEPRQYGFCALLRQCILAQPQLQEQTDALITMAKPRGLEFQIKIQIASDVSITVPKLFLPLRGLLSGPSGVEPVKLLHPLVLWGWTLDVPELDLNEATIQILKRTFTQESLASRHFAVHVNIGYMHGYMGRRSLAWRDGKPLWE